MGADTASLTRNIFDEEKLYQYGILPKGMRWVDADENDHRLSSFTMMRRLMQIVLGDGYPAANTGFQIVGTGATNNFTVKGGGGTGDTTGLLLVGGYMCRLFSDVSYDPGAGTATTGEKSIHPRSTALAALVLTDSAANYTVNELAGRTIRPNLEDATSFTIASNTATTITVTAGDMTTVASVGDNYLLGLSTPGGSRTDEVWLNAYVDEFDGTDDPNLNHTLIGAQQLRGKLIQSIFVREGAATPLSDYTDSNGKQHKTMLLATLNRTAAIIGGGEVVDERPQLAFTQGTSAGSGLNAYTSGGSRFFENLNPAPVFNVAGAVDTNLAWNVGTETLTVASSAPSTALQLYFLHDGAVVRNFVAAGSLSPIADGDIIYVNLNSVSGSTVTLQRATLAGYAPSSTRAVLGLRSSARICWITGADIWDSGVSGLANLVGTPRPPGFSENVWNALANASSPTTSNPLATISAAGSVVTFARASAFNGSVAIGDASAFSLTWPAGTKSLLILTICPINTGAWGGGVTWLDVTGPTNALRTQGLVFADGTGTNFTSSNGTAIPPFSGATSGTTSVVLDLFTTAPNYYLRALTVATRTLEVGQVGNAFTNGAILVLGLK